MAQKDDVSFELLVFSGSRWEAQGVYAAHEQRTAVADAKSLAKVSTVKGVKVVKESYDPKSGASRSLTVYEHNPQAPAPAKQASPAKKASKASLTGDVREGQGDEPQQSQKGSSILGVFVKVMVSLLFSLAAAMVVTQLASFALQRVHTIGLLGKGDFLNLVFILVFVITALALITRILVTMKKIAPIMKSRPAQPPKPAKRTRSQRLTPSADVFKQEREKSEEDLEKERAEEQKQAEEAARLAEEEAKRKAIAEAAQKAEADALSELVTMNAFAEDAFDVLQGDKSKQDAHTVFGLVLFLVGAVQALRHQHKLSEQVANTVMSQTLSGLGLSKDRAEHFSEHIDEYLVSNPRYTKMFQSGRGAMGEYLSSETGPRGALADALSDWDKPKSKADDANKPVTVLFTDIAGSTAMTQKLGDEGAQVVVRSHNSIVREAIQGFSGKEIKHTGDGIMASFPSATAGVEAAMEMQKRTKSHNETDPSHPLGLKIGLNAGEPISEDDDLFGTTVQLAARIVDKADAGQILASGSVHGLSQGKNLKFERFADLDMKGFDDPVTVYRVIWGAEATESAPPTQPEPAQQTKSDPIQPVPVKAETPNSTEKDAPKGVQKDVSPQ